MYEAALKGDPWNMVPAVNLVSLLARTGLPRSRDGPCGKTSSNAIRRPPRRQAYGVSLKLPGVEFSEDCLYLNIWTPEWPAKTRKPVMFWLYGGGNERRSGNDEVLDGSSLASHGVVVVVVNYRLGVFGFLTHPELTKESPHHTSGNYGLLDQIAALKWVRDNIAQFGGDPGNVTAFGASSGSMDIGILMTSPLAKGLIHRAIHQSTTILSLRRIAGLNRFREAEQTGEKFTAALDIPVGASVTKFLRKLPADVLFRAASLHWDAGLASCANAGDGWVVPTEPMTVYARHNQQPIPILLGNDARESSPPGSGTRALRNSIREAYGDLAEKTFPIYGVDGDGGRTPDPELGDADAQWSTDVTNRCSQTVIALWHSAVAPTYRYQFGGRIPGKGNPDRGSFHGLELPYVFGTLASSKAYGWAEWEKRDFQLSKSLQEY